jgi:3-hydroxyisobutyrate dehydrogenase
MNIGWIGVGRMGLPMATRVLNAGYPLKVWNRTRDKAERLVSHGATVVEGRDRLRDADVVFTMLATGPDLIDVCFADGGLVPTSGRGPGLIVDCSTIGLDESRIVRDRLAARGVEYLAAPVAGNPQCVVAGKLSSVVSGPKPAFDRVAPVIEAYAVHGVSYVGDGELARICKIAHNVFLATIIANLSEVMVLAQKAGVPRHAFLKFINNSPLGSIFTQYKSPALVNLDFTPTFTMLLLRKDVDLGLTAAGELDVAMPITATVRELVQSHFGVAAQRADGQAYLSRDFATIAETLALYSGLKLQSENVEVPTGLET